jgi:hypothetical protein
MAPDDASRNPLPAIHALFAFSGIAPNKVAGVHSVWKGEIRLGDGVDINPNLRFDAVVRVLERDGTRFKGKLQVVSPATAMAIEGNIDAHGNLTWRATEFLDKGVFDDEFLDTLVRGSSRENRFALVPCGWGRNPLPS